MPGRGRNYIDRMLGRNEGSESRDFTNGRRYGEKERFFDEEFTDNEPQFIRKTEYMDRPDRNHLAQRYRNQASRNDPRSERETRLRRESSRYDYNVDAGENIAFRDTEISRGFGRDDSFASGDFHRENRGFFGKGPKGWRRSDERIKEEVSEALYRDYRVDASDIEVDVKEGIVTLSGTIDSRVSKRAAEECIEHLSGVIDVHNRIRIADSKNVPNPEKRSLS